MIDVMRKAHNERGFTLAELLAVLLVLGGLSAIAVLSVAHFVGHGTAEAANTEVHNVLAAISSCMADAGTNKLDSEAPVNWDGTENIVTATSSGGVVYDAADSLRGKRLNASYIVAPDGSITGVASQKWSGVVWENGHWKKAK
ncbi:MAG: prepilin-type N-terminal cleavage/methylation domain-containing protein [Dehalococcoidia bacterium]|nr:prepilin-type N-terminal cleavage/methylation domain-containing protein [Dehalococcoidia bacterium]